jgi:glycerol-3-phosphate O-acyltransferase
MNRLIFLDVDDVLLSPPYQAVKAVVRLTGKAVPSEERFLNRSHIQFYEAFPEIFKSKTWMWIYGLLALPFGYFRSHNLLKMNPTELAKGLADGRVYLVSKNPPSFTRWRIRRLEQLVGVNVGDRYIACGPIFARSTSKTTIIRRIAERRGVELQNCLLIDDCPDNLTEAAEAGIRTAIVSSTWNRSATHISKRISTEEVPQIVREHLGDFEADSREVTYLLPPWSLRNGLAAFLFFAKRWFLYSDKIPAFSSLIPIARNPVTSLFVRDPQARVKERLSQVLDSKLALNSLRVVSLGRGAQSLPLPMSLLAEISTVGNREQFILRLREGARELLEASGNRMPRRSLFHFARMDGSKEVARIMASPRVSLAIEQFAFAYEKPVNEIRLAARKYAEEISASRTYQGCLLSSVVGWVLFNRIFGSVRVKASSKIKELEKDHFLVYSSIHRSYLDSGILYWVLGRDSMQYPFTVAADKMRSVWIGKLGALNGSMFIQRKFIDTVYAAVLSEHIRGVQMVGGALNVFLEGQRSRSGLTLPPKKGIISSLWQNLDSEGNGKKVALVPVSFAYNKLPESEMLINERYEERVKSGTATLREMADMVVKRRRRKTRYQKIRSTIRRLVHPAVSQCEIRLGDPIPLERDFSLDEVAGNAALQESLNRAMFAINNLTSVFPSSILCLALLGAEEHHLECKTAIRFLELGRALLASNVTSAPLDLLAAGTLEKHVGDFADLPFVNRKFKRHRIVQGSMLAISDLDIERASYYKNNVLHLFVLPSLLVSVLLESRQGRVEQLHRFLDHMFTNLAVKYFLPDIGNAKEYIDRVLATLAAQRLIVLADQSYTVAFEAEGFALMSIFAKIGSEIVKDDLFELFENFRRATQRVEVDAEVEFSLLTRRYAQSAKVTNFSVAGFFLEFREPFELGDHVRFYEDGKPHPLHEGVVVRQDIHGVGVRGANPTLSRGDLSERRTEHRVASDRIGNVTLDRDLSLRGKVSNVSSSGALIATDGAFQVGDRLQIKLRRNFAELELVCLVTRTLEAGLGVRFIDLSKEKEAELTLFVFKTTRDKKENSALGLEVRA